MVHCVLFEMGEQLPKPHGVRTQARDLVLKMFDYFKWKRPTVGQRTEVSSRSSEVCGVGPTAVQRAVGDVDWKWNKDTVIYNARTAQMSVHNY
jgi:hypothetical protein